MKVLEESTETTVGRVLASRPYLQKEAEVEVALARAAAATAASSGGDGGEGEMMVPSLEELIAEKAEELRTRLGSQAHEEAERPPPSSSSSAQLKNDNAGSQLGDNMLFPVVVADAGWPWPVEWLAAPRVPPPPPSREADILGLAEEGFVNAHGFGSSENGGGFFAGSEGGGERADPPVPFSIEVAAVEVVDAEDFDTAHVEVRESVLLGGGLWCSSYNVPKQRVFHDVQMNTVSGERVIFFIICSNRAGDYDCVARYYSI